MLISVFTPFHKRNSDLLLRAWKSLRGQTHTEWEWVLLGNGEAKDYNILGGLDARVSFFSSDKKGIGALKKEAVSHCKGEIVVELDYDDTLTANCLEELVKAFEDEKIDFAYSDTYHWKDGKTHYPFSPYFGWEYETVDGMLSLKSFDAIPSSISYIWHAPDHVRAWRKSFYDSIGGHDEALEVADDHDIVCRTYIAGTMHHIKKPLYNYYHHKENTSGETSSENRNADIQIKTIELHDKYMQDIALKWSKINNLHAIDLGGRFNSPKGFTSVDLLDADVIMDLTKPWTFEDNSVGVIRAHHILEHLHDTIHFMNEAYRVLAPGGVLLVEVPSMNGSGGVSDPTHVKFFVQRSFEYYTNQEISQYIQPQFKGKFQKNRIAEYFWSGTDVAVIRCDMIADKGGRLPGARLM